MSSTQAKITPAAQPNQLLSDFKRLYQQLDETSIARLDQVYASSVKFKDPVHDIEGVVALQDYLSAQAEGLSECRFEYLDELIADNNAYIKWVMRFRHEKLGNRLIAVRGVSHLHFSDKIDFHEDVYDMGALLYDHIPVLGRLTRWLKVRLAR
ncbi:nuclear transport factor 2 family protein [Gilvimarinus agarilyticus]|uniref:nuclear transport factor 2 family protein n=1 Tax=Gilvimarinus agarilyticus TaxID=679259 RepID=UPI000697403F|nr:nuclear transport factor 2 family protein [Gilvimarinus agarilyticus]